MYHAARRGRRCCLPGGSGAALQACLKEGTATLVSSAAAGLHLPGCDADILVQLPGFTAASHAAGA